HRRPHGRARGVAREHRAETATRRADRHCRAAEARCADPGDPDHARDDGGSHPGSAGRDRQRWQCLRAPAGDTNRAAVKRRISSPQAGEGAMQNHIQGHDVVGGLDRVLVLEVARVTEAAAIAAARLRGRGDEKAADGAAVDAMRRELAKVHIRGRVVIGEGEMDESPMLYIGEEVGLGDGPEVDIAVDPLEGTTICAKAMPNALAVLAIAERGGLLNAPDMYMNKIAIGPGYPEGILDLDAPPGEILNAMAKARGVPVSEITACILDRPRHADLIAAVRKAGAGVQLIPDGDIAGVIWTTDPKETGIDIYFGIGGAPEGVLAAAALRCIGGQMQGRLHPLKKEEE